MVVCENNVAESIPTTLYFQYDYEGEMYNFKSPSYDILVTPNHRMVVKPEWKDKHKIIGSGLGRPMVYDRNNWNFKEAQDLRSDSRSALSPAIFVTA